MTTERRLLRMSEAADALGVSKSQLYILVRQGHVRAMRLGKSLRIPMSAVDELDGRSLAADETQQSARR